MSERSLTAGDVMRACVRHWDLRKDDVIPRCCACGWEADLLIIRPSGWAEEVEIKVSLSDYRAEFRTKAQKHEDLQTGGRRCVGIAGPPGREPLMFDGVAADDPRLIHSDYRICIRDQPTRIRRFWFAMPAPLAERLLPEVPPLYGVLSVAVRPWGGEALTVLRPATNLQPARKLTPDERIRALRSAYFRWWQTLLREPPAALEAVATAPPEE